jgi:hypothetical protein
LAHLWRDEAEQGNQAYELGDEPDEVIIFFSTPSHVAFEKLPNVSSMVRQRRTDFGSDLQNRSSPKPNHLE